MKIVCKCYSADCKNEVQVDAPDRGTGLVPVRIFGNQYGIPTVWLNESKIDSLIEGLVTAKMAIAADALANSMSSNSTDSTK